MPATATHMPRLKTLGVNSIKCSPSPTLPILKHSGATGWHHEQQFHALVTKKLHVRAQGGKEKGTRCGFTRTLSQSGLAHQVTVSPYRSQNCPVPRAPRVPDDRCSRDARWPLPGPLLTSRTNCGKIPFLPGSLWNLLQTL